MTPHVPPEQETLHCVEPLQLTSHDPLEHVSLQTVPLHLSCVAPGVGVGPGGPPPPHATTTSATTTRAEGLGFMRPVYDGSAIAC